MEKNEPGAAALLTPLSLTPPSREKLETILLTRHRRSGVPLEFVEPPDLNPLIRRRLRLSRGDKARQEILRQEYFDRVSRLSEGNIAMAVLLWLRSADFDSRKGWLRIHPPLAVRLFLAEDLDLDAEFGLKAFLEHGSLTLEEYGQVFDATPEEAFQTFEILRNRMLLEPLSSRRGGSPVVFEGPKRDERYRIPAVLSQVVARRLKNRNILH
jgi:hypothetical protein